MIEWKKDIIEEIVQCYNLKEGWDGDGATKPDHKSLNDAFQFMKILPEELPDTTTGCIHLYGRYSISLYNFGVSNFFIDIEFAGDGKVYVFMTDDSGYKCKATADIRFAQKFIKTIGE